MNSYMYDDRMFQFLSQLAEMHVDPSVSDPRKIEEVPDDARSEGEERPNWSKPDLEPKWKWSGIQQDVGIFSEREWNFIMCKCLASMGVFTLLQYDFPLNCTHFGWWTTEIPLADAGSLTTGPSADTQVTFEINRLPKAGWRICKSTWTSDT